MSYTENPTHREGGYLTAAEANKLEEGLKKAAEIADNARVWETPEAAKAITAAKAEEPSTTKVCFVSLIIVLKAEASAYEVLVGGKLVAKVKRTPLAGDIESVDFIVPAGKTWEYKLTAGALTSAEAIYQFQR